MSAKAEYILTNDAVINTRAGRRLVLTDNHMHLDTVNGYGIAAARKFEDAGGRFLFLVCKTTKDCKIELKNEESFSKLYEFTIDLSQKINQETGIKSFAVIGIHPAEFVKLCRVVSIPKALEIGRKAIDIAKEKILAGEAVALGEIGRPHFKVEAEVLAACNVLLRHAFEAAAEIDCALQLHTESAAAEHFEEFQRLAKEANLAPKRVIKHFSPPLIKAAELAGIFPSIIARKENLLKARREGTRFLMESDYIDDLRRPDAVRAPDSVPQLSLELLREGLLSEEDLWRIHKDNIEEAYGMELE